MFTSCAKRSKITPISVPKLIKVIARIARRLRAKRNNFRSSYRHRICHLEENR